MNKPAERLQLEALALRHVLTLPEQDRAEACAVLDAHTLDLVGLVGAVARALQTAPGLTVQDVNTMLATRPELRDEAQRLQDNPADSMNPAAGWDPRALAAAYRKVLADTAAAGELRRLDEAAELLNHAKAARTAAERRALLDEAAARIARAERADEGTLAETWDAHLAALEADEAGPDQVLRLNPSRGAWAGWFNDWLGTRAGLEPGQTFILGGAAEAGKTSLAALVAADALAVGCPVLFWQLELGREETLEHLQAQHPDPAGWWKTNFWQRARRPLPPSWADLLTVPRWPESDAEAIRDALLNQARKTTRDRRAGKTRHACNGLVVVDYAQLLTVADKGPSNAQHEVLATAASRLAKAAGESGAVLLLLSQLNKQEQRDAATAGTALAGADLQRMAHRVALLQKATAEGKPCKAGDGAEVGWDKDKGEARLLTWTKARGVRHTPEGRRPGNSLQIWNGGRSRALHGGDQAATKKGGWEV
jgi:hypothetical protein